MQTRDLATTLYREGKLPEAIAAQIEWVRNNPADVGARLFLFELLAFDGQWERALRQSQALLTNNAESDTAVGFYQKCVAAELKRKAAFQGGPPPRVLGEPTDAIRLRIDALAKTSERQSELVIQAEALESAPVPKTWLVNGRPVTSLRDGDDLLGPVLEVFAQGEYFWININEVYLLESDPPRFPRDLLWLPARLETATESGNVFLPLIYHGSAAHQDHTLRLGRATDWTPVEGRTPCRGLGLKEWFLNHQESLPLVEVRSLIQPTAYQENAETTGAESD